jgi:DNA-binding SARP family transcriptional activator
MPAMRVHLFGRFDAFLGEQPSAALNNRAARELFCYLALHRDHPQRRATLAGLFWEDAPPEQARKNLRQALWQIQRALRPLADEGDVRLLEVDPEWIQLNSCEQLQLDVARFDDAMLACHGVPGAELGDIDRTRLEDAVSLYRGDLLEGWYHDWCMSERERFENALLDGLEKLVCACEVRHESERGLAHARRMLAHDPAREQVYRHAMYLHLLAGNRTQAIREFHRCERALMQELGIRPSGYTTALYEAIRDGSAAENPEVVQLPALAELLDRAQHLFAHIEARVHQLHARLDASGSEPD